ncbi:MAG: hypothetical protein ACKVW3_14685 [Phycisphaerales bacterium]
MRSTLMAGVVGMLWFAGAAAQGQDAPPSRGQPAQRTPPLKGPEVRQNRPPTNEAFSESTKRRGGDGLPMRTYAEILGKLRAADAPANVRLSPDQEQKIGAIEKEFREAAKAYGEKARRGAASGDGGTVGGKKANRTDPNAGGEMSMVGEAMRAEAPRPGDYQTRIWAMLSAPQREFVQGELEKARQDQVKKRSEAEMQKRLAERAKANDGQMATPGEPGVAARPNAPARPGQNPATQAQRERARRIIERLAQLPADERERILSRLEQELDRRAGEGKAGEAPRRRGAPKPAPEMGDVNVPKP